MLKMETYTTKDFYLTVLLMTNGFKLIGSEQKDNGVHFHIENKNDVSLRKLIDQFINFEAVVNMGKMLKCTTLLRKELDKYKK